MGAALTWPGAPAGAQVDWKKELPGGRGAWRDYVHRQGYFSISVPAGWGPRRAGRPGARERSVEFAPVSPVPGRVPDRGIRVVYVKVREGYRPTSSRLKEWTQKMGAPIFKELLPVERVRKTTIAERISWGRPAVVIEVNGPRSKGGATQARGRITGACTPHAIYFLAVWSRPAVEGAVPDIPADRLIRGAESSFRIRPPSLLHVDESRAFSCYFPSTWRAAARLHGRQRIVTLRSGPGTDFKSMKLGVSILTTTQADYARGSLESLADRIAGWLLSSHPGLRIARRTGSKLDDAPAVRIDCAGRLTGSPFVARHVWIFVQKFSTFYFIWGVAAGEAENSGDLEALLESLQLGVAGRK